MASAKRPKTVAQQLANRPVAVHALYAQLREHAQALGPFTETPSQGLIHFVRATAFVSVFPRRDELVVSFKSDQPAASARIFRTDHTSARRYYHYVHVSSPADLDPELLGWLAAAYALGGERGAK